MFRFGLSLKYIDNFVLFFICLVYMCISVYKFIIYFAQTKKRSLYYSFPHKRRGGLCSPPPPQ